MQTNGKSERQITKQAAERMHLLPSEIEEILNAHLPPEARQFHNWWANQKSGKRAQSFAWMAAGWVVSKADIKADLVKFTRQNLQGGGAR